MRGRILGADDLPASAEVFVTFDGALVEHHLLQVGRRKHVTLTVASLKRGGGHATAVRSDRWIEACIDDDWIPIDDRGLDIDDGLLAIRIAATTAPEKLARSAKPVLRQLALSCLSALITLMALFPLTVVMIVLWLPIDAHALALPELPEAENAGVVQWIAHEAAATPSTAEPRADPTPEKAAPKPKPIATETASQSAAQAVSRSIASSDAATDAATNSAAASRGGIPRPFHSRHRVVGSVIGQ